MRVLVTTSLYPTPGAPLTLGGAEIFARQLAERLVDDGHSVEVVRASPHGRSGVEVVNGVEVHSAPVSNIYFPFGRSPPAPLRALWHAVDDRAPPPSVLARRIEAFRPDVVHSNTLAGLGPGVWRVARAANVPVVHTLHDYYLTCPRCDRFRHGAICRSTCAECGLLTRARRGRTGDVTALVGVSRRIIDIHREHGLFESTPIQTVVRNASRGSGIVERDARTGPMTFGFLGRFTIEKGVHRLAEAFGALPAGAARLVLGGRVAPEDEAALRALAPGQEIEFLGWVEPAEFFRRVDVVVLPSLWEEPGSLVIEEALAAGRPLMVSPYGGSPEVIEPGRTGWVVEPTVPALTALLEQIVRAPEEVASMHRYLMGEAKHRTMQDVERGYVAVYDEVLGRAPYAP